MVHVIYGTVNMIEKYFNAESKGKENVFDEVFYQENYFNDIEKPIVYESIRNKINLSLDELNSKNIVMSWTKPENVNQGNLLYRYANCGCRFVGTTGADFIDYE